MTDTQKNAAGEPVAWNVTRVTGRGWERKIVLTEPDPKDWASVTPLYATPQPAPVTGGEEWPEAWSGPVTVGNMIANLRTLPPETPLYSAYHVIPIGKPAMLRVQRPTLSRERVDGLTIKTGDESIPYSAVIWSHPKEPDDEALSPSAPEAPSEREKLIAELVEALERASGMVESAMKDTNWSPVEWDEDSPCVEFEALITRARKIGGAS